MSLSYRFCGKLIFMELHERLQKARAHAGYKNATEAAAALRVPYPTYAGHENGSSGFRAKTGKQYARKFGVRFDWLMTEDGPMLPDRPTTTRIVGKAGAATDGAIIFSKADEGLGRVFIPEGAGPDSVAIEIEGYSMGMIAHGALVFYSDKLPPADEMIGTIMVVGLADGQVLLKKLQRGSKPGLYDLESVNGPVMHDRKVKWVAHVDSLVPPWRASRLRVESDEARI